MRDVNFREWLGRRRWKGAPLKAGMIDGRIRRLKRIERALDELGFEERDLDALHTAGGWPELVERLRLLFGDWRTNEAAARSMAPQSPDPTRQLLNIHAAARQYGHFADGRDPNYDAEGEEAQEGDFDKEALAELKARFLAKFPDFESGGGFPGESSYHPEEDEYKRPLIAAVQARLSDQQPLSDESELGGWLLDQLLPDGAVNLIGDYRRKQHLRAVRGRSAGALERAVGRLMLSRDAPPQAAEAFTTEVWPLILEGSEQSKPYGDSRVLATLLQALARPTEAISVATRKFENLAQALDGRKLFGWNPLTAAEYGSALNLAQRLCDELEEWGWAPRDFWDVQGFIWVTCEEKLVDGEKDADRIRRHVLDTYVEPARQHKSETVDVLVRDVNEALGLNQAWPNICQALAGRKFLELAGVSPPERIGANQSSATVFRFHLAAQPGKGTDRPFVLFDAAGEAFKPVLNFNRRTERSAYRIKPPGAMNKTDDALEVDTLVEVARAMLVEGRPARVQSVKGGTVNYVAYGKQKLVRYELDPVIARLIGVPPSGSIDAGATQQERSEMPNPTNLILYGPPGTGKTYRTAAEAVRLCDGLGEDDTLLSDGARRADLMARYRQLAAEERIDFVTFHQSIGYEDFVEGLRPTTLTEEGAEMAAGFRLQAEAGAFRKIAERAEALSVEESVVSFPLAGLNFFKMSLGEAGNPADDYLFEEAIEGGFLHMGDESGIDWSQPQFNTKKSMIDAYADAHPGQAVLSPLAGAIEFPFTLRHRMRLGDIVIVSKGNLAFRAVGEVIGEYQNVERDDFYTIRRAVKWHWVDRGGLSYDVINNKRFSQRTVYELAQSELKIEALQSLLDRSLNAGAGIGEPRRIRNFVLVIDEINRANVSKVFGELITLIEPDKRIGQPDELRVLLPHSKKPFGVPANLHIVGTMNTADRSIALLDTALRRRFVFREVAPKPDLLPDDVDGVPLRRVLEVMNERIEYLVDRDHRIGHAFFMGEGGKDRAAIDATMRDKIIPLLQEYFFEDWSRVAAVLGGRNGKGGGFLDSARLKDPAGDGEDRPSWRVRATFTGDAYLRLVGAAVVPDDGARAESL